MPGMDRVVGVERLLDNLRRGHQEEEQVSTFVGDRVLQGCNTVRFTNDCKFGISTKIKDFPMHSVETEVN